MPDRHLGDPIAKASILPYIVAMVVMALITIVAILLVTMMRPSSDNFQVLTMIIGFAGTITAAIMSMIKSQETHLTVNSQYTQWKKDFASFHRAEGAKDAVDAEQQRVQKLSEAAVLAAALAAAIAAKVPRQLRVGDTGEAPIPVKVEDSEPVKVRVEVEQVDKKT